MIKHYDEPEHRTEGVTEVYRAAETDTHWIEVVRMGFNWRVHTVRKNDPMGPFAWSERYWCSPGNHPLTLLAALVAVRAWDGADDTEPVGWIKSWDQRYGNPGIGQRGPDGVLH